MDTYLKIKRPHENGKYQITDSTKIEIKREKLLLEKEEISR